MAHNQRGGWQNFEQITGEADNDWKHDLFMLYTKSFGNFHDIFVENFGIFSLRDGWDVKLRVIISKEGSKLWHQEVYEVVKQEGRDT